VKIALSILCENPHRKTGLTTLFHELVRESLAAENDVEWIVFAGPEQEWSVLHPRVQVVRDFPANDHLQRRLIADHFQVPARAGKLGAEVLVTVGFVPMRKTLPTVMHMLSLQHLDPSNKVGFLRQSYRTRMARRGFRDADAIITNSEFARTQILSRYPNCADRLSVSYEGVQHDKFRPEEEPGEAADLEKKFGLRPGYLLWVSNFYTYKQAELLLDGYAELDAEDRRQLPLVMVGGGWDNGVESAEERARARGIRDDVHFLGWIEDRWLAPLYRQARIFALPSREETFGRCVLEAMACGTPCVVNDIPIMHEVTAGNAEIVNFSDSIAVAAALLRLLPDSSAREELRAAGIRRAAEFSFQKLARERMQLIRAVLSKARR
jgi:glycosyltransferase involved in cell wall biosynthesis